MGGAPPPPLGVAPQGPKKPEKFGLLEAGFGRVDGPEDHAQRRGVGGSRPLPDPALKGRPGAIWPPAVRGSPPAPFSERDQTEKGDPDWSIWRE